MNISQYIFNKDLLRVATLNLIGATWKRLNQNEKKVLAQYLKKKNLNDSLNLLRGKYSKGEWEELLDNELHPLLESYFKEVLFAEVK